MSDSVWNACLVSSLSKFVFKTLYSRRATGFRDWGVCDGFGFDEEKPPVVGVNDKGVVMVLNKISFCESWTGWARTY